MIGTSGGAGPVVAMVAATTASFVLIITTLRGWLRSYVDERADIRISAVVGPLDRRVSALESKGGHR